MVNTALDAQANAEAEAGQRGCGCMHGDSMAAKPYR